MSRTYETTLTLPSGAEIVVEGRPGSDPTERDDWDLLATTTDDNARARFVLDADEEKLAREALVERWCDAQRDIEPDDDAACVAEMRAEARRALRAEV